MAYDIKQAANALNDLFQQATGADAVAIVDNESFLAVANTMLDAGWDKVTGAINNVLTRTLFDTTPYSRKLVSMHRSAAEYGMYTRQIHVADSEAEDSLVYANTSAAGVDMYRAKNPVLKTTFIGGGGVHMRKMKISDHQFKTAFTGPEEFMRFMTMLQVNFTNQIEQTHELEARSTLCTYIAGKIALGGYHVIYLLDEYNLETGQTLDTTTVKHPDNYPEFVKWMFARMNIASDRLTERTELYHVSPGGIKTRRFVPKDRQHMYIYGEWAHNIGPRVLGDVYHPERLSIPKAEVVNFWQGMQEPSSFMATAKYPDPTTGKVVVGDDIIRDDVVAVIADRDVMGLTTIDQRAVNTPFNAAGRYYVQYAHFTDRTYVDHFAPGVVFCMTES